MVLRQCNYQYYWYRLYYLLLMHPTCKFFFANWENHDGVKVSCIFVFVAFSVSVCVYLCVCVLGCCGCSDGFDTSL